MYWYFNSSDRLNYCRCEGFEKLAVLYTTQNVSCVLDICLYCTAFLRISLSFHHSVIVALKSKSTTTTIGDMSYLSFFSKKKNSSICSCCFVSQQSCQVCIQEKLGLSMDPCGTPEVVFDQFPVWMLTRFLYWKYFKKLVKVAGYSCFV